MLSDHLNPGNPAVQDRLHGTQAALIAHGYAASDASPGALGRLSGLIQQQAATLSFNDAFLMIAAAFLLALPLAFVFQKGAGEVDTSTSH